MSTFYTGVDKQRYDEGNKFVPMDQFLLDYKTPTTNTEEEVTTSYGIPNTNAFVNSGGGGGGNYRTDYRPNYEYRQYVDGYDPNLTATMNMKMMEMDPNYKGPDYYNAPAPTGLAALIHKGIDFIPGVGMFKKGAEFLGNTFGKYMPVNQRAIMENELRGAGVYTDDIGRIVAGPDGYNTAEGIMAGYNANQMTDKTFDKRTDTISETLMSDKFNNISAADIKGIIDGTISDEDIEEKYGITTNLTSNLRNINLAKQNWQKTKQKADDIYEWEKQQKEIEKTNNISKQQAAAVQQAIIDERGDPGSKDYGNPGGTSGAMTDANAGTYCFDPSTPIQMADGSEKKIKEIQLGDQTKGGEVTGVFQFKASDEIHDYKGVTVAGSHYVKEDGRFIMVKDSPLSVKIDKIPVVYSLDTTGRRIFINDIEFADYNGDGIAKGFLANAGVNITGFDKEVLRQVENRLL